jgi:serine/threonine protein kinase
MADWTQLEEKLNSLTKGRFEVLYPLDGQKQVYLTKWNRLKYRVVKIVPRNMINPDNIRVIQKIRHEHISSVYFVEQKGKEYIIVKEYVEGETLHQLVDENGPLSEEECINMVHKLLNALEYLHEFEHQLIYRDIQPKNIIIDGTGEPVLIDTESIRMYAENKSRDTVMIGTAGFIAPEQFGFNQSTIQSDIYSLGALMFYAVTGRTISSKNEYIANDEISKEFQRIIFKMTNFTPEKRYKSIKPIRKDLIALENSAKKHLMWLRISVATLAVFVGMMVMMLAFQNRQIMDLTNKISDLEDQSRLDQQALVEAQAIEEQLRTALADNNIEVVMGDDSGGDVLADNIDGITEKHIKYYQIIEKPDYQLMYGSPFAISHVDMELAGNQRLKDEYLAVIGGSEEETADPVVVQPEINVDDNVNEIDSGGEGDANGETTNGDGTEDPDNPDENPSETEGGETNPEDSEDNVTDDVYGN